MATVYYLLPSIPEYTAEMQQASDEAERTRRVKFIAARKIIAAARIYLVRKHLGRLKMCSILIQGMVRRKKARKTYWEKIKWACRAKAATFYYNAAVKIQCLWRGYWSRRTLFCYRDYRRWLYIINERGKQRTSEAVEFGIRSKADNLRVLEEEARQWLAFVVFKLHHLLRTYVCSGIYSDPATTELSEFEKLLKAISYLEYMKRLKRKYDEFVRKYQPAFSNKKLFPIIGQGADYWYLSLPEMYEITTSSSHKGDNRHKALHHGKIHEKPFLWKKVRPPPFEPSRGPFPPPRSNPSHRTQTTLFIEKSNTKDPRFHLYVKYYKPNPAVFDYVNFNINVLLKRKCSIENIILKEKQ